MGGTRRRHRPQFGHPVRCAGADLTATFGTAATIANRTALGVGLDEMDVARKSPSIAMLRNLLAASLRQILSAT
jgi:hypothetical protein